MWMKRNLLMFCEFVLPLCYWSIKQAKVTSVSWLLSLGVVPEVHAGSGNESATETDPRWNLDITFIKSTSVSYGPWVDRQRYMNIIKNHCQGP